MTDAAAMNILSLSTGVQDQLLRQYFSPEGERGREMLLTGRDRSFREETGDKYRPQNPVTTIKTLHFTKNLFF